tara:strand:- start:14361 stop:14711 length:351 start_codon:yes stop_codon:yes gene_type:complete
MEVFNFEKATGDTALVGTTSAYDSVVMRPIMVQGKRTGVFQVLTVETDGGTYDTANKIELKGSLTGGANDYSVILTITDQAEDTASHNVVTLMPYMKVAVSGDNTAGITFTCSLGI